MAAAKAWVVWLKERWDKMPAVRKKAILAKAEREFRMLLEQDPGLDGSDKRSSKDSK